MTELPSLPTELILSIVECLPLADLKSTSETSLQLRRITEPLLFGCLRIPNREQDRDILETIIEKYGRHVEKLVFELDFTTTCTGADDGNLSGVSQKRSGDNTPSQASGLTALARQLLNGDALPDVSQLRITFEAGEFEDYEGTGIFGEQTTIYMHDDEETREQTREQEEAWMWRATMNEMYKHLSFRRNLKHLELRKLVPRGCSTFYTAEWQAFLSRLDELDINIWGGDNGAGWHSNTTYGYMTFIEELNEFFFDHLDSVRRCRLAANDLNPIGMTGFRHSPVPFKPKDMPKLMELELENCFIDPALADHISNHGQQLRSLGLKDCFAKELIITNEDVALTKDEEFHSKDEGPFTPRGEEPESVKVIRRRLEENPASRLWPYVYLDDKYGMVFQEEDSNVAAFEDGADQSEYDAWMALVHQNKGSQS